MNNIKLFLGAFLVSCFLIPFGIIWNLGKSLYNFLKYWFNIIVQLYYVAVYLSTKQNLNFFFKLAYGIDLIWNVVSGELLEDLLTNRELTKFGIGGITVSASTGKEVVNNSIAKRGRWFPKWLDKLFKEKDHCKNAWLKWEKENR